MIRRWNTLQLWLTRDLAWKFRPAIADFFYNWHFRYVHRWQQTAIRFPYGFRWEIPNSILWLLFGPVFLSSGLTFQYLNIRDESENSHYDVKTTLLYTHPFIILRWSRSIPHSERKYTHFWRLHIPAVPGLCSLVSPSVPNRLRQCATLYIPIISTATLIQTSLFNLLQSALGCLISWSEQDPFGAGFLLSASGGVFIFLSTAPWMLTFPLSFYLWLLQIYSEYSFKTWYKLYNLFYTWAGQGEF